jgi:hypothetical protein
MQTIQNLLKKIEEEKMKVISTLKKALYNKVEVTSPKAINSKEQGTKSTKFLMSFIKII